MENKYNKILAICLCMKQLLATNKLIQKKKKCTSNVDVTNVLGTKFGEKSREIIEFYDGLRHLSTIPLKDSH